jgi:hypothetical protein
MARDAALLEGQLVTGTPRGSKLCRMRFRAGNMSLAAVVLAALAWSPAPQASSDDVSGASSLYASDTVSPGRESKPKERPGGTPKCPDGGERVPEKRSPYDSLAPLSPLVA